MTSARALLARAVDVRRGEGAALARAGGALFLIIAAHVALETARDALLLSRLPARDIALVYVAVAVFVLPVAAITSRLSARIGPRRTLAGGLMVAALALVGLFLLPLEPTSVIALYVLSGVVGATLVPL